MDKILIIENEEALVREFENKFLQADFDVEIARSAEQGLELLKRKNPDIVLLDVLLPKGNGIHFLKRMKKSDFASTSVIAFSEYSDPEIKHQAKDLGADHYLIRRNYTVKQIVKKVKEILNKTL